MTFDRETKHGLYLHCENFFYIGLKCGSKSFCLKEEHRPSLTFKQCSFKKNMAMDLIMSNKYSWQNWDQRKSQDNREIWIIVVQIIEVCLYEKYSFLGHLGVEEIQTILKTNSTCQNAGKPQSVDLIVLERVSIFLII